MVDFDFQKERTQANVAPARAIWIAGILAGKTVALIYQSRKETSVFP